MTVSAQQSPAATALAARIGAAIPVIETERLVLRVPRIDDFDSYAGILMSDRSVHIGGPFNRHFAWLDFGAETSGWTLHGYGSFAMEDRATGRFVGMSVLHHEIPDPEPELGWMTTQEGEGQGFAHEAAAATRDYVFGTLGWDSIVSYIAPENVRSIALAERLGARRDQMAEAAFDEPVRVYRHFRPGGSA